ncbi:hypothetical protein Asp14428_03200 [Actinoplanes sp. NBRC 14428]|nr:hypothetical protein Asp14428_03200 [Actinoplanes sp. NBRC 14428]
MTLGVNGSTFAYRGKAKLTAKLGTTHDSRALCLWATPRGGTKTKVKCGAGTVTATYATTRRTTFSATFAGDQWYAPATATRTVTAHARITQALDRSYRTSGAEKLYRTNVDPVLVAMVSPAHPYGCIDLHAQVYDAGKWWPLPTARCVALDGTSIGGGTLVGTHKAGMRYRLRAAFAGDALNASATGSWQYLRFTR